MIRQLLLSGAFAALIILGTRSAWGGNRDLTAPYGFEPAAAVAVSADTIPPLQDRYEDFITNPNPNPFDLNDPAAVEQTIEYDPASGMYMVTERVGETLFRPPSFISFEEYMETTRRRDQKRYFDQLGGFDRGNGLKVDDPLAGVDVKSSLVDRLFGGNEINIQPQGSIDLTFGFDYSYLENPILTERQKRRGGFNFDMAIQMNVTGQIGEKLKLKTNYNTQATFDFDNQIKIDYGSDAFGEDDIMRKIEAGNVSLPLRGQLIQGAQSLFGLKTELQFGHLRLTAIASQQKSQNESITVQGGAQVTEFEVKSDEYDENRHFFLSHYNRAAFEGALTNLPQINSLFRINQIEVWVTNNRNEVENTQDILAFADLGEPERLTNPGAIATSTDPTYREICDGRPLPDRNANDLWGRLTQIPDIQNLDQAVASLQAPPFNFEQSTDFEKVRARKLNDREYTFHPELGFLSLNIPLQPNQVLAVSFSYTYNGQAFTVGQFATNSDDVSTDTTSNSTVLFTKMLKSTTQRTDVPTWDLMMKNVYSIGAYQVNQEDFKLDVFYEDPGKGVKRFLPRGNLEGKPLVRVFNLDRLNVQGDPQPDGIFDFVPGVTINPANGRIIFPVLEPFGSFLANSIDDPALRDTFVYQELYDQTIFLAREFPEKNRYVIKGSYKSSVASEISLGAFNIPQGSVTVTAGRLLEENVDYQIDYSTGRLRILNDAILASGVPVTVSFEDNTVFGLQNKTMLGLRADYALGKDANIGATFLNLFERPFTPKVNQGDDPINNRIYGLDFNMSKDAPFLTRLVDKLPFYSTSQASSINVMAEVAALDPGHARAINQNRQDKSGIVYIDDFEGSASTVDLRLPTNQWYLASVPITFPEARVSGLTSGANRALLNWYRIDPVARSGDDDRNPYTSLVPLTEVFPNLNVQPTQRADVQVFDLAYYPGERGPYNFDVPGGISGFTRGVALDPNSPLTPVRLNDPATRWGGIMRAITVNDFQSSNIEYVEFWMLSPFLSEEDASLPANDVQDKEGTLYLNLGNISEDILKDSRRFFENGLPGPANPTRPTNRTSWGRVPVGQQITRAFDNDPETRILQDVGLDGLSDDQEAAFFSNYVEAIRANNPVVADRIQGDVANDNFRFYNDNFSGGESLKVRYRQFNGTQGNSGAAEAGDDLRQSGTNIPDSEDLDRDNTLNENEAYFQYRIPLFFDPSDPREIDRSRTPYITDRREDIGPGSGNTRRVWYRFRVPLNTADRQSIGGIRDFRSIRFMRMYVRDFEAPVTLRFASLELVRSQWRRYTRTLAEPGQGEPLCNPESTDFQIDAVNIEENASKEPFSYTLPRGIQREQSLGVFNALQNEQSLALRVDNLCDGDSKAVFKYSETDMRVYERLQMFVHAEERNQQRIPDDALSVFIRLGSDFTNNYYEYEIPLKISREFRLPEGDPNQSAYKDEVWLSANQFDFPLAILRDLKVERNAANFDRLREFIKAYASDNGTEHTIRVKGEPNLGFVKVIMIGVRNPRQDQDYLAEYSTELWVNELRLTGLDERGGVAGIARVDMNLADLGSVSVAGNFSSIGFGALDNGVQERQREQVKGYDLATQLELGRFLPTDWGVRLPFYAQRSNLTTTPEFDPYDLDIRLKDKVSAIDDAAARDSVRRQALEISNLVAYNFTNVGKERTATGGDTKPKPWDIENFTANYGYSRKESSDPLVEADILEEYQGGLGYSFSRQTNYLEPFKGLKSKYLRIIKEINLNPLPGSFSVNNVLDRRFRQTRYRFSGVDERFNTFFNKSFLWNRTYDLNWDITRSLKFSFNASANAVIDEPDEIVLLEQFDGETRRDIRNDSIWTNIRNLGRPKLYQHGVNVSYTLPLRYLPYMDWVQVRGQYQGGYNWNAASLNVDSLGNIIQNNQTRQISADLNFDKLYDEFAFLKKINRPARPTRPGAPAAAPKTKDEAATDPKDKVKDKNKDVSPMVRALVRPLLLVRKGKFTYSEQFGTTVPGFMPQTQLLGLSSGFSAPGWGFVAGLQPTIRTLSDEERAAANAGNPTANDWLYNNREWITTSVFMNRNVIQTYSQNYEGRLTLEPFQEFRIEIEGSRSFTENYSETFKIFDKDGGNFEHAVPNYGGQLTLTYNALSTLFRGSTPEVQELFKTFESYRPIISQRLGTGVHFDPNLAAEGYTEGYGRTHQEVLIPAFIAAYTGEDPNAIDLNPFNTQWRPNWRVTYGGLAKLPAFKKIFSSFNISHSYKSTFTISNYSTGFQYLEGLRENPLGFTQDEFTFNYYPRLEIPDVVIQENFAPLLALDMQFQNSMSFNIDYKQSRTLALNVVSKIMNETRVSEIATSFGYVVRNFNIPFLTGKKNTKAKPDATPPGATPGAGPGAGRSGGRLGQQDLDLQLSFSYRDDLTVAQKLDQEIFEPTRGSTAISLSPSAEYQLNKNLSLRAFLDYRRTLPKVSSSFPRTDAAGGIVVRFQLN